jgi:regulator of PEP synthase PpsR (kinase-PPPase family)
VLVGISRTSKTPTSIYLANRGIKVANVPVVPGIALPRDLEGLKRPLVVGLTASADRIVHLRENRVLSLNAVATSSTYVDKAAIAAEIAFARKLCLRNGWPMIDVTRRSIEETAAAIVALRDERTRKAHAE